eukprot:4658776-Amphidinium_carterae.1
MVFVGHVHRFTARLQQEQLERTYLRVNCCLYAKSTAPNASMRFGGDSLDGRGRAHSYQSVGAAPFGPVSLAMAAQHGDKCCVCGFALGGGTKLLQQRQSAFHM